MPFNEPSAYMEKHSKHDPSLGSSSSSSIHSKEPKNSASSSSSSSAAAVGAAATASSISNVNRLNENPLVKYQGCKWDQIFDFDKMLKQIRNAERHYLRGSHDYHYGPVGSSNGKTSSGKYPPREQPQVQRLNASDMHFYGMVPKQPFDVVVCDICLGIYTKMGFNNHMKIHHPQAWNLVSTKSTIPKETGHVNVGGQAGDNHSENVRVLNASGNPLAESTSHAVATSISTVNNSRHKSSKSGGGSSGGSSRSRSKSKHHHHHQQQSHISSSSISTHTTQASASNTDVSTHHANSKSSKKSSSTLISTEMKVNASLTVPKEIPQPDIQPITIFSSSSSNSSCSLPPTPKMVSAEVSGSLQDAPFPPIAPAVIKEKSKGSKRKSKSSSSATTPSVVAPITYVAPETNESSNSSLEYTTIVSNASTGKSSSKRSIKAKTGKDLKQLMEPQLSELDQAVSSITDGQIDAINEISNSNDIESGNNIGSTTLPNCGNSMGYNTEETALTTQVPMSIARQQQHQQQQLQGQYTTMSMLPEGVSNPHQQPQLQQQTSNSEDNDNSMLTFDDMLDSKFINEILNTDESVIHFDESELDKAAQQQQHQQQQQQQQQQQHAFLQQVPNKRMRYDDQIGNGVNVEVSGHQSGMSGKYASFQQQQQQQQHGQQAFQVTNIDDIKMYATAIDPQQYLNQAQQQQQQHHTQDQHQITTIDPIQLQQLLYQQQQQQQGLNAYTVGGGLDEVTAAAMEQQQYTDSDVIMCSAEQLHKEGKINAADYATLAALSGNNNSFGNVCDVNAIAAAAQFQVYNIPSLTDDDDMGEVENTATMESKICSLPPNDVIVPQNHYVLPDGNEEEQLIYEITANNQVAVISQQRQQQMIAEFLTQAGYDSVDNVNMNNSAAVGAPNATEPMDVKCSAFENELHNELLDFDFSRLETVTSCASSSSSSSSSAGSSSAESKHNIKIESNSNGKYVQSSAIPDDVFLNLFLYAGLPRPLAVNCFGLIKLPQAVATTFRKNLHTTRKANNSPVSLNGAATRFATNATNTKSTSAQNYFTALGTGTGNTSQMNEFSIGIGSITITNQGNSGNSNLTLQQQQLANQKHGIMPVDVAFNAPNANGLITANTSSPSPPTTSLHGASNPRSSRPKSAGSANVNTQSKQRTSSSSATSPLPQAPTKTIFVNNSQADQSKFIKRNLISRTNLPAGNFPNFTAKQLSDLFLHPTKESKEKYLQLLASRDQDKDPSTGSLLEQQRMNKVKSFYERRKRLLNTAANAVSSGCNHVRPRNSQQVPTASAAALLRQRLMRTLSDCSINIKSNNNSANSNSNSDILRVFA